MKILIVHQYYLLPGMPGGSRFNEFARMWAEAGHEVTVVAGTLDYATGTVPERYRGRWVTEERDGQVRVLRCHVPRSYGRSYLGRMWAFLGWTLSSLSALVRLDQIDVVVATSPPLVAAFPGWAASRLRRRRIPWIFEVRDLWPESAVTTGVLSERSPLTRILYQVERFAARTADRVNVLTPAFRTDMLRRGLASEDRFVLIPNGADADLFQPGPRANEVRERLGWGDRFVALYAGAHGRANALHQLVEAAELLRDRSDIHIACVGDGPERAGLEARVRKKNLQNIAFYGAQPKASMPDFVNAADVGLAVLQDNPTFRTVYPNKVFDYMACNRPTLLAIDGVARQLVVDEARAGLFAQPESGAEIAEKLIWLSEHPQERSDLAENGRRWVLANATRDAASEKYLAVMAELVEKR